MKKESTSRRIFLIINGIFLILIAVTCLLPLINVLAISFSSNSAVSAGLVKLWPVDFTLKSYEFIMKKPEFLRALLVSIERVAIGVPLNMLLLVLTAYPLSKEARYFKTGRAYIWIFVITMLFSGGLIPLYMVVKGTGLIDTIWALIIPNALPVYSVILLLNFFRGIPRELEEAAFIDGAGHFTTLAMIYMPLSLPSLATLTLFSVVGHWNSWFDGMIFANSPDHYPLQSYLQRIIVTSIGVTDKATLKDLAEINDRTAKAAQIFIATLPILCVYPFLQKYFITGLTLGGVKG